MATSHSQAGKRYRTGTCFGGPGHEVFLLQRSPPVLLYGDGLSCGGHSGAATPTFADLQDGVKPQLLSWAAAA